VNSLEFPEQQAEEETDVSVAGDTLALKGEGKAETEANLKRISAPAKKKEKASK